MTTKNQLTTTKTRRNVLKSFVSALGSASVLSKLGLSGLAISATGLSTSGCMGETSYDQGELDAYEPFWAYRADRLEAYQTEEFGVGVRSKDAPGPHNPDVHHPEVSIEAGILTAKVNHVMELDHWITTMYARDLKTGRVFYLKEFHPTETDAGEEKGASISTPFPPEVTHFAVFAFCNKHELWWHEVNLNG